MLSPLWGTQAELSNLLDPLFWGIFLLPLMGCGSSSGSNHIPGTQGTFSYCASTKSSPSSSFPALGPQNSNASPGLSIHLPPSPVFQQPLAFPIPCRFQTKPCPSMFILRGGRELSPPTSIQDSPTPLCSAHHAPTPGFPKNTSRTPQSPQNCAFSLPPFNPIQGSPLPPKSSL